MMPSLQHALLACGSAFALCPFTASAECFSMYDAKNALVFQSASSPIDLSRPVSEEMARRFPNRALVIATSTSCTDGQGGTGGSRFIGADESGALYGSATSPNDSSKGAPADAAPARVVRRSVRR